MAYFFMHCFKTGGTSMRQMIVQKFPSNLIYTKDDGVCHTKKDSTTDAAEIFVGHSVWYGMHEELNRNGEYFTFFRDPVERLISYYYHHVLVFHGIKELDFDKFMGQMKAIRLVVWLTRHPTRKEVTVKYAKEVMEKMKFIGLMETFTQDITQIFPNQPIIHTNVNSEKSKKAGVPLPELTDSQMKQIIDATREDLELYEYAIRLRKAGHNNGFTLIRV